LEIALENTSDEEITVNLTEDDFVLSSSDGVAYTPSSITGNITDVNIPAGETETGELDYTVDDPIATYILEVTGFDTVLVDASADPENR
jgi:hypothetical protein